MGKLEELSRLTAGNVNDSIGVGRPTRPVESPAPSAPARWQGVTKSKNAVEIPVEKIAPDPDQPREEFDEEALGRLAESLKTRGQLQPIRVRWDEGKGVYMVLVGERRWRAARMAGLSTLSAVVVEGLISPAELLAIQLIENCLREDLKPIEQAKAFKALMERNGWSARQVARELSIDHTGVARALALLTLPEDVLEAVEAGQIAPRTAYELTKIDDPTEQAEAAREAAAGRLKRDELAERTRKPREGRGGKPRPWSFSTDRVKVAVSALADDVSEEELTEAIAAALKERRRKGRGRAA
jgi:ParB family transcriptional regulator, chromosome partitioning protein